MFLREAEKSKRVGWLREVVNYRVTLRFVQVNQKAVFLAVKPSSFSFRDVRRVIVSISKISRFTEGNFWFLASCDKILKWLAHF